MFLKKLEIQGFKSFAKKTVMEFGPGITSIVGPNGSGKSNIADALRWAFGEQSMKTLRSKKSEDVIFAGSSQKARLGEAYVGVYFNNQDRVIPIDYSEVVIGRRVARDGTSEYLLNSNQVRLMDIQELLAKTGFGNSSYHVIGQGMIDQLILGGPSAVKELVEEAAGIKPYYIKRDRSLRRLEKTENNLEQIRALIKEIEPRLKSLRRQTKRLEKREELADELKSAQTARFARIFRKTGQELKEIDGKIEVFDKQLQALEEELSVLSAEIDKEEGRAQPKNRKSREVRETLDKLREKKSELLEKQAVLRGELKAKQTARGGVKQVDWQSVRAKLQRVYERVKTVFSGDKRVDDTAWRAEEAEALEQMFQDLFQQLEGDGGQGPDLKAAQQQLKQTEEELTEIDEQIVSREADYRELVKREDEQKQQVFVKERLLRGKQDTLVRTRDEKNQLQVEKARLTTRLETHEEEAREALGSGYRELVEEFAGQVSQDVEERVLKLKKELEQIGGVDELTMQEYRETEERYNYLNGQADDLEKSVKDLRSVITELDEVIKKDFSEAFREISNKFSEYFRVLFGGGKAVMSIQRQNTAAGDEDPEEDESDEKEGRPRTEVVGIQITATPPGKKLTHLSALSGGERALASIALLSALLDAFPSPFVVLDEVDAALDEANSIRFGKILGQLAESTQFITITHNRETMRQSHTLYGITMGDDGVSRILSLKLEEAAVYSTKN